MSITTRSAAILVAVMLCVGKIGFAQAQLPPQQLTVAFSDPGRVGKVRIDVRTGSITIRGTNRKDVLITARVRDVSGRDQRSSSEPPPAGFRRVPRPNSFDVEESSNVIVVSAGATPGDFDIEVPTRTNLQASLLDGHVNIRDVEGDIEVNNTNGGATMTNVGGAIVANSFNNALKATIARVTPDKPMAISSFNGVVDVTFPASIKAMFKLRSDHGEIITNFDLQMAPSLDSRLESRPGKESRKIEAGRFLLGAANGGGPEIELRSFNGSVYLRKGN
jgi:hypothetical protein